MSEPYQAFFSSEIGNIRITASETAIETLYFVEEAAAPSPEMPPVLQECLRQLEAYFRGELKDFSLKLQPQGTAFQQSVWQQLLEVPYGSTATYLDIARRLKDELRMGGAWYVLASCHEAQGQWSQAVQNLKKVVCIDQKYQLPKLAENTQRLHALESRISAKTGHTHE